MTSIRKLLSYSAYLMSICIMMFIFADNASAQKRGEVSESFKGDGTSLKPYLISSDADLRLLSDEAKIGKTFEGKYFCLTNDIVINQGVLKEDGEVNEKDSSQFEKWVPIEDFRGVFDGYRYSISGLYINGLLVK